MRLWSLHPRYLDAKGLVALWREGLLAQKVLQGQTKGYQHHPQLNRFKEQDDPISAIAVYLKEVEQEARKRSYHFDASKIAAIKAIGKIKVSSGQLEYEMEHLRRKLTVRDPHRLKEINKSAVISLHPLFRRTAGPVADWERT